MDNLTTELVSQWHESAKITQSRYKRAEESLKSYMKINKKLADRCKEKGLNMNEILKQSK